MDKVAFPYRSSSHLPLLYVVGESGAWEKHGLDVAYDKGISSSEAHRAVPAGDVEFVGGNHVSTYAHRARGDSWVYLGQTVNVLHSSLAVRPDSGINGISDLREKKVGTRGSHPGLNDWLYLKQRGLDADRDEVEIINQIHHAKGGMDPSGKETKETLWQWVKKGKVDAAFLTPPQSLIAKQQGLKVIDIEPMPMIWFTSVSTSITFVQQHPGIVERFLKGLIEGIHFFKMNPKQSTKIIQDRYTKEGKLTTEQATFIYEGLAPILEPKLYPTMAAISNVYQEGVKQDKDALRINPMELWDLHHIRQIDDSGFIGGLYGKPKKAPKKALKKKAR